MPPIIRKSVPARPVQFTPFTPDHFSSPSGIAFFNQWASQIVTELNRGSGQSGPVAIHAGIDLGGAKLTGLSTTPTDPSDAVSLAHADANYSPAVNSPALDIGGKNALKGLTSLFLKVGQVQAGLPNNYTGGGAVNLFGLIIQLGHSGTIPDGSPGLLVPFPTPFLNACQSVVAVDDFAGGGTRNISVVAADTTTTQFRLWSDGSGAGAYWIAAGW